MGRERGTISSPMESRRVPPIQSGDTPPLYCSELTKDSNLPFLFRMDRSSPRDEPVWDKAKMRTTKGWSGGPHSFTSVRNLFVNGEELRLKPAFGFGVLQCQKLRAAGDFKMGGPNRAAAMRPPINLPSRDRAAQIARSFSKNGWRRTPSGDGEGGPRCRCFRKTS